MRYYAICLFIICLSVHLFLATRGWNNPIVDLRGFRQTQTAISTYYYVKDGLTLNYSTPVLGAPWSIPMEFPFYQAVVAMLVKLTHFSLDQTGRFVSLFFFYGSLAVGYFILKQLTLTIPQRFLVLTIYLMTPIYIFWSRTFMIESAALFFTLLFLLLVLLLPHHIPTNKLLFLVTVIIGSIAALIKISTFVSVLFPVSLLLWYTVIHKQKKRQKMIAVFFCVIPLAVGLLWTTYADYLKYQNPLASGFLTAKDMRYWNFGTKSQKISSETWNRIIDTTEEHIVGSRWILLGLFVLLIFTRRYRTVILISVISYFLAPLIFTNLYYVHEYYFYANAFFLVFAVSLAFLSLVHINLLRNAIWYILLPGYILLLLFTYKKIYYPYQVDGNWALVDTARIIEMATSPDDVILIYGYDWSSEIPYYAKRKAIVDRGNLPLSHPKMEASIQATTKERFHAMLVRSGDPIFIKERVRYFGFAGEPVFQNDFGALYVKTDEPHKLRTELHEFNDHLLYDSIFSLRPEYVHAPIPVQRKFVKAKQVLLVHAPGELVFRVPREIKSVEAHYGIVPIAFEAADTDGVVFRLDWISEDSNPQILFEQQLTPRKRWEDRSMQYLSIDLPSNCPCILSFKTLPGASESWDWSYWTNIQFH